MERVELRCSTEVPPPVTLGTFNPVIVLPEQLLREADAENLEERIMTILRRPKLSVGRKSLLLISAALVLAVPGIAAASYSRTLGIATQDCPQPPARTPSGAVEVQEPGARRMPKPGETARRSAGQSEAPASKEARELERNARLELRAEQSRREFFARVEAQKLEAARTRNLMLAQDRVAQAELARKATITMQQAIQIAVGQMPGQVIKCSLVREKEQILYRIRILAEGRSDVSTTGLIISTVEVVIDAHDGRVVGANKTAMGFELRFPGDHELPVIKLK